MSWFILSSYTPMKTLSVCQVVLADDEEDLIQSLPQRLWSVASSLLCSTYRTQLPPTPTGTCCPCGWARNRF